jgi:hypothetical protein
MNLGDAREVHHHVRAVLIHQGSDQCGQLKHHMPIDIASKLDHGDG